MSTEPPAERLRRRLGAAVAEVADVDEGTDADVDERTDADGAGQPDATLSRWLPESAVGGRGAWLSRVRADPGRAGVIALGGVGLVAVLVTVVTLVGDHSPAVVSAKLPPVQPVSSSAPMPGAAPSGPPAPVVVSVVGLVRAPGLVTLEPGARIADALDAAGGALDGADVVGLNMARRVSDGEQIVVGIGAPAGQPVEMGSSILSDPAMQPGPATPTVPAALVDLNSATIEQLDTLPGVGPVTAAAIVSWRDANGRFSAVDQLGDVDGIGPVRLEKLRALVQVG